MKALVEDEEPPAWALELLKFSEDLVLESSLLEGGEGLVSTNGRAAISTDNITCVPIIGTLTKSKNIFERNTKPELILTSSPLHNINTATTL